MTVTAPETAALDFIKETLDKEFEADGIVFRPDKIHGSMARNAPRGGIYPEATEEMLNQGLVANTTMKVQLFHRWNPKVDPEQQVDPRLIANDAERIRRSLQAANLEPSAHLWFFRIPKTEFPPDPTGNISRCVVTVLVSSQNAALTETAG